MMQHLQKLGDAVEWGALPSERRAEILTELLVDDADCAPHLASHIESYLTSRLAEDLIRLQVEVVRRGLWAIGEKRFVHLVAGLATSGLLSHRESAFALTMIPYPERDELPAAYADLVDVADLVIEDAKDGVMQVDDDDAFRLALARFVGHSVP